MHRNLRSLILGVVMIVSVFGVGLHAVHAQDAAPAIFSDIGISNPGMIINSGNYIETGTDASKYAWIYTGWTVIRQMSNILVLLFLFIASAATTLNLQIGTYGIKRMLPTIITGTILANMSREISSIFLSVEHALSSGFISMAGGATADGLWGNLAAPVRTALQTVQPTSTISSVLGGIIYLVLATVGVIALLLLILLFWIRKIILGFLIILAPLAFLSMAAPFSQGMFRKWWSEYIKWMFMPAVSVFFISVGGIIVASIMTAGAFSFIAFLAALLSIYLAIKTPFMMGGMVGAAAGFIAGNTWGRVKGALGESAQIAALQTPGVGHAMRYFNQKSINRKNALEGLRKRPVMTSTRLRDQRIANDRNATAVQRQAAQRRLNSRVYQFRNWAAENFERSTIVAGSMGTRAERLAKENRAASLDRYSQAGARGGQLNRLLREDEVSSIEAEAAEKALLAAGLTTGMAARKIFAGIEEQRAGTREKRAELSAMQGDARIGARLAAEKLDEETVDTSIEQQKLDAENEYRQSHEGLSMTLAESQEQVQALKDKIEGFTSTMKAAAIQAEGPTRALRRQATLIKEIGTLGYAEQLAEIKEQIRETSTVNSGVYSNAVTEQLENDATAQRQLELLLGPGYGDQGSVMKSALVRLGGRKNMLEETVAAMEKTERGLYSNSVVSGISSMHGALNAVGMGNLINHNYTDAEFGTFASEFTQAESAAAASGDSRIERAIEELGISHLSRNDQMQYLFNYLGNGRKELRGVTMKNGAKLMGEVESGQRTFTMKDASMDTVVGTLAGDRAKTTQAIRIMRAGGVHTQAGAQLYAGLGRTNRERQEALDSMNRALARTQASVERVATIRTNGDLAHALNPNARNSWINEINHHLGASALTDATPLAGLSSGGNPLTLADARAILNGTSNARVQGPGGRVLDPNNLRNAIQNSIKAIASDPLMLQHSTVDNVFLPQAA